MVKRFRGAMISSISQSPGFRLLATLFLCRGERKLQYSHGLGMGYALAVEVVNEKGRELHRVNYNPVEKFLIF